jgi:acrylyl-CoA reductase (NADPH)
VTACGLAASNELPVTVYPFILRAVTLAGIDAAWCPMAKRIEMWRRLSTDWKLPQLETIARFAKLAEIEPLVQDILAGRMQGRVVVEVQE